MIHPIRAKRASDFSSGGVGENGQIAQLCDVGSAYWEAPGGADKYRDFLSAHFGLYFLNMIRAPAVLTLIGYLLALAAQLHCPPVVEASESFSHAMDHAAPAAHHGSHATPADSPAPADTSDTDQEAEACVMAVACLALLTALPAQNVITDAPVLTRLSAPLFSEASEAPDADITLPPPRSPHLAC